jgi:hypothetical protein
MKTELSRRRGDWHHNAHDCISRDFAILYDRTDARREPEAPGYACTQAEHDQ